MGFPWVVRKWLGMKGVTVILETVPVLEEASLEDAEDLWILYLRRYHMKATIPTTSRAATTAMTALAALPICEVFRGEVVIELNCIVRTGILCKVGQP